VISQQNKCNQYECLITPGFTTPKYL